MPVREANKAFAQITMYLPLMPVREANKAFAQITMYLPQSLCCTQQSDVIPMNKLLLVSVYFS